MLLTYLCFYNYIYAIIYKQNNKKRGERNALASFLYTYIFITLLL